ncbi:hypothetical protein [Desulfogranum marinum]|uniref:hypothetical protein n=1 Tax=Desulfogranum marinum TaxID=453220 RepID=UPI001965BDE6|nr:hypothetical protein [Desulfogranum marinum]MBM9514800.1 hypothetical protein [Desulfogranum marinum]
MSETFSETVKQINAQLRSFGSEAVQQVMFKDRDGKVIGQIRYGFKPQYVFDAVNEILQPENWRYEIVSKEIFDFQAVVEVKLFIRIANEWLCKGSHTGQMNIVKKNVGDAYKGAVTDALQKCFSLVSIGSDAYRGLLEDVYKSGSGNRSPANNRHSPSPQQKSAQKNKKQNNQPKQQPQTSVRETPPQPGPQIAGVDYQQLNGRLIAIGDTFNKKELLKADGFRWDGAEKNWYKEVAVH